MMHTKQKKNMYVKMHKAVHMIIEDLIEYAWDAENAEQSAASLSSSSSSSSSSSEPDWSDPAAHSHPYMN